MESAEGDFGNFDVELFEGSHNARVADRNKVDVTPILNIIQDVLQCSASTNRGDSRKYNNTSDTIELEDTLTSTIQKVSFEITCKCSGGDVDTIITALLKLLSDYAWGAKLAIALGALAITYGEFRLVGHQFMDSNPLAMSVAKLKKLPKDLETESSTLKHEFEKLIGAMLEVTRTILKFKKPPLVYTSWHEELPSSDAMTQIYEAAYWTIRSVVACATHIAFLIGNSSDEHTTSTTEQELSNLIKKESELHIILCQHLKHFTKRKAEIMQVEEYNKLVIEINSYQNDNIKILRHLICKKDGKASKPIVDVDGLRVNVEAFKGKTILLLISGLKPSVEKRKIIHSNYTTKESTYEIVWIPIIDTSSIPNWKEEFDNQRKAMFWYTLEYPEVLEPTVIRYIKEVWNFSNDSTILVMLDSKGNAPCNVLNRYLIWGDKAIHKDEEALWREENHEGGFFQLFFNKTEEPQITTWIAEGKSVFVYGGDDSKAIKELTECAMEVASNLENRIKLEIIYAGKSNQTIRMGETKKEIEKNKGHVLGNMEYFWARLKCMLYSKTQHEGNNVVDDRISKLVHNVNVFDNSDQTWAMWFEPGGQVTAAKGNTMLKSLKAYDAWKENVKSKHGSFILAFEDNLVDPIHKDEHHCNKIIVPGDEGGIPNIMKCADCKNHMKMYFMYRCCKD